MSNNSRFIYMPASALASRQIIDQSSYTTTPNQSPTDPTPSCGEYMYKRSLDNEEIKDIDFILEMERESQAESTSLRTERDHMAAGKKENKINND